MNASVVDGVIEFLHTIFLRTFPEVAMLNDTLESVAALMRPNSYRDVKNDTTYSSVLS